MDATEKTTEATALGIDPETGFATDGEWPINGRLRAEAMVAAGVTTDPAGLVSDELILDTKDRLARDEAAAKADAAAAPSMKWTEKDLRDEAARLKVPVESDANKAAILAAIQAATAAGQTEA